MRLCLLFCLLLLSACTDHIDPVVLPPPIPAVLLLPCTGYQGDPPTTQGEISEALIAEAKGRACANGRLATVSEMLQLAPPSP